MDDTYNAYNYDTSSVAILAQSNLQARQQSEAPLPSQQCPVPKQVLQFMGCPQVCILMAFPSMIGKWKDMLALRMKLPICPNGICSSPAQPS